MTCTDQQVRLLLRFAQLYTRSVASAKAGMSLSTAKRYLRRGGKRVKKRQQRARRTRRDPFEDVSHEIEDLLSTDSGLQAYTIMQWLMELYPGKFNSGQIRTLRRRIAEWRILKGPERNEVMFRQRLVPGRQSQSDFTHCDELEITINGDSFSHMIFHFMLPYSRWEFACICDTESFASLTAGYVKAVGELGSVAKEHRTDSLKAAVKSGERHIFQKHWAQFLKHYGVQPSANNPGKGHENGSVEKSHHLLKSALDQRLRLRGSRDFETVESYESFLHQLVVERNRQRKKHVQEEIKSLQRLPPVHWNESRQEYVKVTTSSTVTLEGAIYSVPSRFIGQKMRTLLYIDRVVFFYLQHQVMEVERASAGGKRINYKHLIFHLLKKPRAFRGYEYREDLFPRPCFRAAYRLLCSENDAAADKEYLKILNECALGDEERVATALTRLIDNGALPTSEVVKQACQKLRLRSGGLHDGVNVGSHSSN